jgi:hypothetical protein
MTTALTTTSETQDVELWLEIAYDMATDQPDKPEKDEDGNLVREPTTGWLAKKYDLSPKQALAILTHPKFTEFIHGMQTAIARVNFDRKAYNVLDEIMEHGGNKERIAAIKTAAELLGYKQSGGISVNLSFDSMIRKADIVEGEAIDVEVFPGF